MTTKDDASPCGTCRGMGWFEGAFGCFDCSTCKGTGLAPAAAPAATEPAPTDSPEAWIAHGLGMPLPSPAPAREEPQKANHHGHAYALDGLTGANILAGDLVCGNCHAGASPSPPPGSVPAAEILRLAEELEGYRCPEHTHYHEGRQDQALEDARRLRALSRSRGAR